MLKTNPTKDKLTFKKMTDKKMTKAAMRLFVGNQKMEEGTLRKLFLDQLHHIFAVKKYLVANLPMIAERASFSDLKLAIIENIGEIRLQILRMDIIYNILGESYQPQDPAGIRALTAEAYLKSKRPEASNLESDMTLLVHLRTIESMEIVSFDTLHRIASSLPEKNLEELLLENLHLAKDSKELYDLITREYIG